MGSSSMAITELARRSNRVVSAPRPGPISITRSWCVGQTAAAMRSRIEPLIRKCWPSLRRATRSRLALYAVDRAERHLHLAPGGPSEESSRSEVGEQNDADHVGRQLAVRDGV